MKSGKQHPLRAKIGILMLLVALDGAFLGGAYQISQSPATGSHVSPFASHATNGTAKPLAAIICNQQMC